MNWHTLPREWWLTIPRGAQNHRDVAMVSGHRRGELGLELGGGAERAFLTSLILCVSPKDRLFLQSRKAHGILISAALCSSVPSESLALCLGLSSRSSDAFAIALSYKHSHFPGCPAAFQLPGCARKAAAV